MTRGYIVPSISPQFRGRENTLILHRKVVRGKMEVYLRGGSSSTFAREAGFSVDLQRITRELTPGSREPGED